MSVKIMDIIEKGMVALGAFATGYLFYMKGKRDAICENTREK